MFGKIQTHAWSRARSAARPALFILSLVVVCVAAVSVLSIEYGLSQPAREVAANG